MKRWIPVLLCLLFVLPLPARAASAIDWMGYDAGLAKARATNKPAYVFVHADFCSWCRKMKAETFTDKKVVRTLNEKFVPIMIDAGDKANAELIRKMEVGPIPDNRFLHPDGKERFRRLGFIEPATFQKVLDILSGDADMS